MTTSDGDTWQKMKGPSANKDEGAFAASGTCVFTRGTREAWFGTGGIGGARVFHSEDSGQTWSVAKTPIRHDSASAGIFSLAFSDALHGIAVGGDYMKPDESAGTIAITVDGGKTWTRSGDPRPEAIGPPFAAATRVSASLQEPRAPIIPRMAARAGRSSATKATTRSARIGGRNRTAASLL